MEEGLARWSRCVLGERENGVGNLEPVSVTHALFWFHDNLVQLENHSSDGGARNTFRQKGDVVLSGHLKDGSVGRVKSKLGSD